MTEPTGSLFECVLIVDDDPFARMVAASQCEALEIRRIVQARSAAEALEHAERDPPDIVLCDLKMPELDGIAFLRSLSARRFAGKVVLTSGVDARVLAAAHEVTRGLELEVIGALSKPIDLSELRRVLDGAREHKRLEPQIRAPIAVDAADLERALAAGELVIHLQPKVHAGSLAVVGAEALVRWQHPTLGLIAPVHFVPVAEKTGLIGRLTAQVIELATAEAARLKYSGIILAANVSMEDLRDVALPELVAAALHRNALPRKSLCLEITETRLIEDFSSVMEVLTRLRLMDVCLSIDDFGTGYASLDKLRQGPFVELKVDRSFVHGARDDPPILAILESSAALGRRLGMHVTAEGVETIEDWLTVREAGVDFVQGYFVSKPMPADEFRVWLAGTQAWREKVPGFGADPHAFSVLQ